MTIGEKLFSYIDVASGLTTEMLEQYKNSLIFLGDEQQIFHPLTGAYVGIGMSYFMEKMEQLENNTALLKQLDKHVHQNVVNSLWANYNLEQFNAAIPSSGIRKWVSGSEKGYGDGIELMTNQDLVVKGLHDTQISEDANHNKFIEKRTTDELGNAFDDTTNTNNQELWSHIDRTKYSNSNYKGSSGIQVNVHHTGSYMTGQDEFGFTYSYFEGQDYLTIDDSLTWAYITSQSSYLMDFSKKIAIAQANRVYHDILGGNEEVFIEKSFKEAFETNEYGDLETIVNDGSGVGDVYVHVNDPDSEKVYKKVSIHNDPNSDYYYIYFSTLTSGNQPVHYIVSTNDPNPPATISGVDDGVGGTTRVITYISPAELTDAANAGTSAWNPILHKDDGWDKNNDGTFKEVAWYHYDAEATAQGQMNLADGIQTLREVSYILDRITDGNPDDVITLTYNIAKNAHDIDDITYWKTHIGSYLTMGIDGSSHNPFVLVNSYSADQWGTHDSPATGYAKIDVDILTAQTYTLNIDGVNISYAAYLNVPSHITKNVWRPLGDTTNDDYYIQLSLTNSDAAARATLVQNLKEVYGNTAEIDIWTRDINSVTGDPIYTKSTALTADAIGSNTTFGTDKYVLFNYERVEYPVVNGVKDAITTVNWVTTYFGHAAEDIMSRVSNVNDNVKEWVLTYIHDNMNVSYNDVPGQFVSEVRQVEGRVEVVYKKLPLDKILATQEVYGNDFFVPISFNFAQSLVYPDGNATVTPQYETVYYLDGTDYKHPAGNLNTGTQYYVIAKSTKFTKIDTTNLSNSNGEQTITNELLLNGGRFTYFQRSSNYQIVNGSTTKVMSFNPVDINELLSAASDPYISAAILDELYYYNATTDANPFAKYFDAFVRQNTDDGSTEIYATSYITYLGAATKQNTGLADAYDVRHTIESMVTFVNLKTNKLIKTSADL